MKKKDNIIVFVKKSKKIVDRTQSEILSERKNKRQILLKKMKKNDE